MINVEGIILDQDTKLNDEEALLHQQEDKELSKDEIGKQVMRRALDKIKLSASQLDDLTNQYSFAITQDFNDVYHMTEEDRETMRNLTEPINEFKQKFSRKIRKLDKYVEAVRGWWDVVVFYSTHNAPLWEPEDFQNAVLKGDIIIDNLYFPEYTGKGKKRIDWDTIVTEYIQGDRDPKELLKQGDRVDDNTEQKILARMSDEEQIVYLFGSKDEFDKIMEPPTEEELIRWSRAIDDLNVDDNVGSTLTKKESKQLQKLIPTTYRNIKESLKVNAKARRIYNDVNLSDMEWIEEYDEKMFKKNHGAIPVWDGKMKHYKDFMDAMDQWEYENILIEYNGRYMSQEEIDELETRDFVINTMGSKANVVFRDKDEEKFLKRLERHDKRKKKKIKKLLSEIHDREKLINAGKYKEVLEKELVKSKENKKLKKKKKKNKKKNKKFAEQLTLDAFGRSEKTWDEYDRNMHDGDWFPGRKVG